MSDVTEPRRRVCAGFVFATSNMFEPASKSESCCTSARDCLEKYDASSCPGNAPPLASANVHGRFFNHVCLFVVDGPSYPC